MRGVNEFEPLLGPDPRLDELSELAALVESSDDAIISKNLDGTIRSWNPGAERLYGYSREEALGQPIAMLAPRDRADEIPMIIERIRHGERVEHFETLRHRKDGSNVYVSLTVSPVRNQQGAIVAASVIARDVTARRESELALQASERRLQAALDETRLQNQIAEEARQEAEALSRRLQDIHTVIDLALAHSSLEDLLHGLLSHIDGRLKSDATMILLVDDNQRFERRLAVGLVDERTTAIFATVGQSLIHRVVERHEPIILEDTAGLGGPAQGFGVRSVLGVPLLVQGQLIGTLCTGQIHPRIFTRDEVQLLRLAADRAAVAIDNARLYERTHSVAETLQRAQLPIHLPSSQTIEVAARYLPASPDMRIGGDWYDAIELPDGRYALMIGDVEGHGIEAATAMGQLRNALRAYAFEGHGPSAVIERLNTLHAIEDGGMTTLVYVVFDPTTLCACFANAGHPPPLVVHPDGSASYLEGGRSMPLGAPAQASYAETEVALVRGSTLLLYTDGLVERRGASIDAGLDRLVEAASRKQDDLDAVLSHIINELVGGQRKNDDVALIALRVG